MGKSRRQLVACGFGILGVALGVGFAGSVGAQGAEAPTRISFPLTTVVRGDPGTVHPVATQDVPADMVGQTCAVTVTADNNGSVHPGSDLHVASGASDVVVADVERSAGAATKGSGSLTLGSTVAVAVELGPDGVFSAGGSVELACVQTTTSTSTSSTSTSTTTATSSTVPPAEVQGATLVRPAAQVANRPAAVSASPRFTG
jgi:hypothetical protein